jgi:hypothetical protein
MLDQRVEHIQAMTAPDEYILFVHEVRVVRRADSINSQIPILVYRNPDGKYKAFFYRVDTNGCIFIGGHCVHPPWVMQVYKFGTWHDAATSRPYGYIRTDAATEIDRLGKDCII